MDRTIKYPNRLLALVAMLEKVPDIRLDMAAWGNSIKTHKTPIDPDPECGFAGCALGWAAHCGIFPGLAFSRKSARHPTIMYLDKYENFGAAQELFGISSFYTQLLFSPATYNRSVSDVVRNIKNFLGPYANKSMG